MIAQIYEIQTPEEAEKCILAGVDHIGSVILSREEWRQPLIRDVIRLSIGTPVKNSLIPLYRDTDTLYRTVEYYQPHFLHFCDNLTDALGVRLPIEPVIRMQGELKRRFPGIRIIRSLPVPPGGRPSPFSTREMAADLAPFTDLFLTDTFLGKEPVDGFIGITGITCDWMTAESLVRQSAIPVILAGGLSPDNVYHALESVRPWGADSCTGTNQVDKDGRPLRFKKDFEKVRQFVQEVRRAEENLVSGTFP